MRKITSTKQMLWLLVVSVLFLSCEDKMEEHYEEPAWLEGSTWEVLESKGNYSVFLQGAELAGFRNILEGKNNLTVMAPNDEAFNAYLKEHDYSSVTEMTKKELEELIGFHILYYSYNKNKLVNFRPEGDQVTDEQAKVNAGLYYKFRTKSSCPVTLEAEPVTNRSLYVYHLERFLPVFSHHFFATKGIDAKSNYEYFFPGSSWTGAEGFNVANASVKEYEIISSNGYIYTVNQVLKPLQTIYTELQNRQADYSVFFKLYNSYSTYEYDADLSEDYGAGLGIDSLYLHKHSDLPPIALEWPVSDYTQVATLAFGAYSVFAPSNDALKSLYSSYWKNGGYSSLNNVDELVMKYLLYQYVYGGSVVFPEEINKGGIKNVYGTAISFNTDAVTDRIMCINGTLYGIDNLGMPALFSSVVGPAFRDRIYCPYLYMLDGSGLLLSMASPDVTYTALFPSETLLNNAGIYLNSYTTGKVLQQETEEGLGNLGTTAQTNIVNMHLCNGKIIELNGSHVYNTQSAYNYWFVKDGKITCNAVYNNTLNPLYTGEPFVDLTEITNNGAPWSNGKTYAYNGTDLFQEEASDGLNYALAVCNDSRYEYYMFSVLLRAAGLVAGNQITMLTDTRFAAFIPTNEAIKKALADGKIPGVTGYTLNNGILTITQKKEATLQAYMKSFFISGSMNNMTSYPYVGSAMKSGEYLTWGDYALQYTDDGSRLTVKMTGRENEGIVTSEFPYAYADGACLFIDSTL